MRNTPTLPIAAILAAVLLGVAATLSAASGAGGPVALSEIQIALMAWATTLALFGLQGVVSALVEGPELRPGTVEPRLTTLASLTIASLALLLFALAAFVALAIASGQPTPVVGAAAGAGCLVLALLLLLFKEAFVGHEAHLDSREDGVPW